MNDVLNKTCPKCKSASVVRAGVYGTKKDGKRQRFECKDCFSTFYWERAKLSMFTITSYYTIECITSGSVVHWLVAR